MMRQCYDDDAMMMKRWFGLRNDDDGLHRLSTVLHMRHWKEKWRQAANE